MMATAEPGYCDECFGVENWHWANCRHRPTGGNARQCNECKWWNAQHAPGCTAARAAPAPARPPVAVGPMGYIPPDGPRWLAAARVGDVQTDGRGVTWTVTAVEGGGRVLHWRTPDGWRWRVARTECSPDHPEYPTDADVVAATRAAKRAARAGVP